MGSTRVIGRQDDLIHLGGDGGVMTGIGNPPLASINNPSYHPPIDMSTVTISPKFQVVIPQPLRESLGIKAGGKLRVMHYRDRIEMIPVRSPKQMRGFLKGMDTTIEREEDRL